MGWLEGVSEVGAGAVVSRDRQQRQTSAGRVLAGRAGRAAAWLGPKSPNEQRTTQLPAASAGASFQVAISRGKFQGMICPTTPSGSWIQSESVSPSSSEAVPSSARITPAKYLLKSDVEGAKRWPLRTCQAEPEQRPLVWAGMWPLWAAEAPWRERNSRSRQPRQTTPAERSPEEREGRAAAWLGRQSRRDCI